MAELGFEPTSFDSVVLPLNHSKPQLLIFEMSITITQRHFDMARSFITPRVPLRLKTKFPLMFPEASPSPTPTVIHIQPKHEQTLLLSLPFSSRACLRSCSVHSPVPCYPQILLLSPSPLSQQAAFDGQTRKELLPRRIPAQTLGVPVLISPFQTSGKFLEETGVVADWRGLERAGTVPRRGARSFILRPPILSLLART